MTEVYYQEQFESLKRQVRYCKLAIAGLVVAIVVGIAVGMSGPNRTADELTASQITVQNEENKIVITPDSLRLYSITEQGDQELVGLTNKGPYNLPGFYVVRSGHKVPVELRRP